MRTEFFVVSLVLLLSSLPLAGQSPTTDGAVAPASPSAAEPAQGEEGDTQPDQVPRSHDATSQTPDSASEAGRAAEPAVAPGPVEVPRPDDRTLSYYRSDNLLWFANYFVFLLISAFVLFTGLSAKMRTFAHRVGRYWLLAIPIYTLLFAAIDFVFTTPLGFYADYLRPKAYGLSEDSVGDWLQGLLGQYVAGVLFILVAMAVLYTVINRSPKRWWLYMGLGLNLLLFADQVITNVWFAPQIQGLQPLEDASFAEATREAAARYGLDLEGATFYEADEQASVEAFLGTKRVLIADPAESELERDQLFFLLAREIGAYRLRHGLKELLFFSLLSTISLYLVHRVSNFLIDKFKDRWGFDRMGDIASWPLFIALANLGILLLQPIDASFNRHQHQEADRYAVEAVQDSRLAAETFVEIQTRELRNPDPGPIFTLWRAYSPPLAERVKFFNTYRPWEEGKPLKYENLIAERR